MLHFHWIRGSRSGINCPIFDSRNGKQVSSGAATSLGPQDQSKPIIYHFNIPKPLAVKHKRVYSIPRAIYACLHFELARRG